MRLSLHILLLVTCLHYSLAFDWDDPNDPLGNIQASIRGNELKILIAAKRLLADLKCDIEAASTVTSKIIEYIRISIKGCNISVEDEAKSFIIKFISHALFIVKLSTTTANSVWEHIKLTIFGNGISLNYLYRI